MFGFPLVEEGERRLPLMVLELLFTEEGELAAKRHRRWTTLVDYHEDELELRQTVAHRRRRNCPKLSLSPEEKMLFQAEDKMDVIPG